MRKNMKELEREGIKPRTITLLMNEENGFGLTLDQAIEYYRRKGVTVVQYCLEGDYKCVEPNTYCRADLVPFELREDRDDHYDIFLSKDMGETIVDMNSVASDYEIDIYCSEFEHRIDPVMIKMYKEGILSKEDGFSLRRLKTPFNIVTYDWYSGEGIVSPHTLTWEHY